jgi:UPF0716 family protein affecting phage T7 exclusion
MLWFERIISAVGGLCLIYPGIVTDTIGLALVALIIVLQFTVKTKKSAS